MKLRIFCASVATETNTFSPLRADLSDFMDGFYAAPGDHPATPTLCSAIFPVCRARSAEEGWELIEGTATWAEPGGLVNATTWRFLRDQILAELAQSLPVQAIVLGLHGAMVAQDCDDCEGDLLQRVRQLVGPDVIIGITLDPHSHLTPLRVHHSDILVAFKEFPHTDFVVAAEKMLDLVLRTVRGEIKPVYSVFDCRMVDIMPTSKEPMRSFVDGLIVQEERPEILNISVIHGFMAADVPEMGSKVIVTTDNLPELGASIAEKTGRELYSFRGNTQSDLVSVDRALDRIQSSQSGPIVLADVWDNPGGGVPGDSTILLAAILARNIENVAFGAIWDPMAVRLCQAAGQGASLVLRFGAKISAFSGQPIDGEVIVRSVVLDAQQRFGDSTVPFGPAVVIEFSGIDIVLSSKRVQTFSPDIFSCMGIDPSKKRVLAIKSTNHFHDAFAPIAADILYVSIPGLYPGDPTATEYKKLRRPIWPIDADPFAADLPT